MTQEEKQLLIKDLCGRLPYGVMIKDTYYGHYGRLVKIGCKFAYFVSKLNSNTLDAQLCHVKPYLRPMSSMTEEERDEFRSLDGIMSYSPQHDHWALCAWSPEGYDWLNENHFDYRGLIPMGLALTAKEGMYKTE